MALASLRSLSVGFPDTQPGYGEPHTALSSRTVLANRSRVARSRPVDPELTSRYMRNSLKLDSPQMRQIQSCASQNKIVVVLGFSENRHNSLYISQATIDSDGSILIKRSKIKATHMERTIFGDASVECLDGVADTRVGRVGALSCWEHVQPLLKYHMYAQKEQIHVAAWPPLFRCDGGGKGLWSMSREGE